MTEEEELMEKIYNFIKKEPKSFEEIKKYTKIDDVLKLYGLLMRMKVRRIGFCPYKYTGRITHA